MAVPAHARVRAASAVLPIPTKGNEVRVATIFRYKGLESPVVVLAEIDERVGDAELRSLLYVGATRARSHLVVIASDVLAVATSPYATGR